MFGKVREVMADAAETLRRAYSGLAVVDVAPERFRARGHGSPLLDIQPRAGLESLGASALASRLLGDQPVPIRQMEVPRAVLHAESGWASWDAGAEVVRMAPLAARLSQPLALPTLPERVPVHGGVEALGRPVARRLTHALPGTSIRRLAEPLTRPATRTLDPGLPAPATRTADSRLQAPAVRRSLEAALAFPVPIQAEDIQHLAKGLWMRYSLQLVRGTGENVRNLEVLGLFRIPRKGVAELHHDPRQGRILVRFEPTAVGAPRIPFILARRKDDGALVSCFVEGA